MRVTKEELEAFLKRVGKRGEGVLNTLGQLQPVATAMESEFGQTFLGDLVGRYTDLLNKMADLVATDEEKVEMKVIKQMLLAFARRVNAYNERIQLIKET